MKLVLHILYRELIGNNSTLHTSRYDEMGQSHGNQGFDEGTESWELHELSRHPSFHGAMDRFSAEHTLNE